MIFEKAALLLRVLCVWTAPFVLENDWQVRGVETRRARRDASEKWSSNA